MALKYDAQQRLVSAVYGESVALYYEYDASGNRTRRIYVTSADPTADHNDNGLYDLWELIHFGDLEADPSADLDSDGLTNSNECRYATNPLSSDTDDDRMPDAWEIGHGLSPTNAADAALDTDGDGLANGSEYVADTDPTNKLSCLSIVGVKPVDGGFRITWQGGEASDQYLEFRSDLTSTSVPWLAAFTNVAPTPVTTNVTHTTTNRTLFYRIKAERP